MCKEKRVKPAICQGIIHISASMRVHKSADRHRTQQQQHELISRQAFPFGECIAHNGRCNLSWHSPPSNTTQNQILISSAL